MKFDKILVPLDGSGTAEQILPYARLCAEAYGARVELLAVTEAIRLGVDAPSGAAYLEKISAERFPPSLPVDRVIERGRAAEVVVDRAKKESGCLIAMATHGRSGVKRLLLGSTASKVVRAAEGPVLLVRAVEAPAVNGASIRAVIVPLDGSELAETVLSPAADAARLFDAELVLARAFQIPPTAYYRTEYVPAAAEPFIPTYDNLVADETREAREYLAAKAAEARGQGVARVGTEVLNGPAAEEVVKLARSRDGSLIALCTHGRSGINRWLLGSVTEKIVQSAESPILILRAR